MPTTAAPFQPFREPIGRTALRTFGIAIVVGLMIAPRVGGLSQWPLLTLALLWISLGGHYVEVLYLNGLRPRLGSSRLRQWTVRVVLWFVAGMLLGMAAIKTLDLLAKRPPAGVAPWLYGAGFILIELVANRVAAARTRKRLA